MGKCVNEWRDGCLAGWIGEWLTLLYYKLHTRIYGIYVHFLFITQYGTLHLEGAY